MPSSSAQYASKISQLKRTMFPKYLPVAITSAPRQSKLFMRIEQ